jgi:hypothetical protein
MLRSLLILLTLCLLTGGKARAAEQALEVSIADPFIELHTGPGTGYPIFHVVDRGETVVILKRRTDWFKIRTASGKQGWVDRTQLQQTLRPDGEKMIITDTTRADFLQRSWEVGAMAGDFGGANVVGLYGAYSFTAHLSAELVFSQILGNASNGYLLNARLTHLFFPEWRVTPYFSLGGGMIQTRPKSILAEVEDRTDEAANVGFGIQAYISRRFVVRTEFNEYVVLTSRDDNEDVSEWKLGFAFFF